MHALKSKMTIIVNVVVYAVIVTFRFCCKILANKQSTEKQAKKEIKEWS